MSTETLHLLSEKQKSMPEFHLVDCCAATLAGMKAGSIFNVTFPAEEALRAWIRDINQNLCLSGLVLYPLRCEQGTALILLFRISQLDAILKDREVRVLLSENGYPGRSLFADLAHLKARIADRSGEFPRSGRSTGMRRQQGLCLPAMSGAVRSTGGSGSRGHAPSRNLPSQDDREKERFGSDTDTSLSDEPPAMPRHQDSDSREFPRGCRQRTRQRGRKETEGMLKRFTEP